MIKPKIATCSIATVKNKIMFNHVSCNQWRIAYFVKSGPHWFGSYQETKEISGTNNALHQIKERINNDD